MLPTLVIGFEDALDGIEADSFFRNFLQLRDGCFSFMRIFINNIEHLPFIIGGGQRWSVTLGGGRTSPAGHRSPKLLTSR